MKPLRKLLKGLLVPDDASPEDVTTGQNLTRQGLLNAIKSHFDRRLKEETTDEGLLFATSFYIYMNEEDYKAREQSLAYTVKDAVNKFNREIVERRRKYTDYRPHARYWQFQFVPYTPGSIISGMQETVEEIPPGGVVILSSIHPTVNQGPRGASGGERIVATVHTKDSMTMSNLAINTSALAGIDIRAKDRFQVPFNDFRPLSGDPLNEEESHDTTQQSRAIIKIEPSYFLIEGVRHSSIYMMSDYLQISGRGGMSDTSGGIVVARVDSDTVMDRQVLFHYRPELKKLFMIAQGSVMLNECRVSPGVELEVYNQSRILINGEIQLTVALQMGSRS